MTNLRNSQQGFDRYLRTINELSNFMVLERERKESLKFSIIDLKGKVTGMSNYCAAN